MPPGKARAYRSYLLRCWVTPETGPGDPPIGRFVVEYISGEPGRRGFDAFEDLVVFLRAELLGVAEDDTQTEDHAPTNDDTST